MPDGERILSWRDLYTLTEAPSHLVVIGSGVTGAEFASGYSELGLPVTLVSSRDRVLPGEDTDAADVIEEVFTLHGGTLVKNARASAVRRTADGVVVELVDGRTVAGSHALVCVGSIPNTAGSGWPRSASRSMRTGTYRPIGYRARTCRTSTPVATAPACWPWPRWRRCRGGSRCGTRWGRRWRRCGCADVAANVFTNPEIATVGVRIGEIESGEVPARTVVLPLATNARAKMQGNEHGFVKLHCGPSTGVVLGATVVAPAASELIFAFSLAVQRGLTVSDVAATFAVYPSLSGSLAEAARQLVQHDEG